jgi:hypothetical protein
VSMPRGGDTRRGHGSDLARVVHDADPADKAGAAVLAFWTWTSRSPADRLGRRREVDAIDAEAAGWPAVIAIEAGQ